MHGRLLDGSAHLGVVSALQRLRIICIACALGLSNEAVQALIDNGQVSPECTLPRHDVCCKGQVPVGEVEGGSMFCLLQHAIHCLHSQPDESVCKLMLIVLQTADVHCQSDGYVMHVSVFAAVAEAKRQVLQPGWLPSTAAQEKATAPCRRQHLVQLKQYSHMQEVHSTARWQCRPANLNNW